MSQVPIYLRRANGICTKIFINLTTTIFACYQTAQVSIKLDMNEFILYCQGIGFNKEDKETTLQQLDIRPNAIVDVLEIGGEKPTQINIMVEFGGNLNSICINELEPFTSIRQRISEIISMAEDKFDMYFRNQVIKNEQKTTPYDFQLKEKEVINIKCKMGSIMGQATLTGHIRQVQSVASSSDNKQDKKVQATSFDEQLRENNWSLKKKNSCTFSLKKINDDDQGLKNIKKSAIEPSRRPYELLSPKPNGLRQITDIKQTMSFGSLESVKRDDFSVTVTNPDKTKEYKFSCLPECTAGQIRQKLAKLQRVDPHCIIVEEIEDTEELGKFLDWADEESGPLLIFKVLSKIE